MLPDPYDPADGPTGQGHPGLQLQANDIAQAPSNYVVPVVGQQRFGNSDGVPPGETFSIKGTPPDQYHYHRDGNKETIVNSTGDCPPLKYKYFAHLGCNTGRDFIETFNSGTFFYSLGNTSFWKTKTFVECVVEGKSPEEIKAALNADTGGLFFDFKKF